MALNAEFLLRGFQAPCLRAHRGGDSAGAEIRGTFAVIGRNLRDILKKICLAAPSGVKIDMASQKKFAFIEYLRCLRLLTSNAEVCG